MCFSQSQELEMNHIVRGENIINACLYLLNLGCLGTPKWKSSADFESQPRINDVDGDTGF